MRLFLIFAMLASASGSVLAQTQIEIAFGLKLGDTLNIDSDKLEPVEPFDNTVYRLTPPKPLSGFQEYLVYVTPLSRKIYQVKAFRRFKLTDQAGKEYSTLKRVLESKYSTDSRIGRKVGQAPFSSQSSSGKGNTYQRAGNSVNISLYTGRDIAEFDRMAGEMAYPRVVITYRSKEFKLRNPEYKEMYQRREEQDGGSTKKRIEEAEATL